MTLQRKGRERRGHRAGARRGDRNPCRLRHDDWFGREVRQSSDSID